MSYGVGTVPPALVRQQPDGVPDKVPIGTYGYMPDQLMQPAAFVVLKQYREAREALARRIIEVTGSIAPLADVDAAYARVAADPSDAARFVTTVRAASGYYPPAGFVRGGVGV